MAVFVRDQRVTVISVTRSRLASVSALVSALVLASVGLVVYLAPSAGAFTVPDPTNPVVGNSTYFDGLGSPYGGCGLPQANLDSQDFVALNVYNTPGDYTFYAWDDLERGAWESPEFIRAFQGRGRFGRINDGRNDSIELSVIAAR